MRVANRLTRRWPIITGMLVLLLIAVGALAGALAWAPYRQHEGERLASQQLSGILSVADGATTTPGTPAGKASSSTAKSAAGTPPAAQQHGDAGGSGSSGSSSGGSGTSGSTQHGVFVLGSSPTIGPDLTRWGASGGIVTIEWAAAEPDGPVPDFSVYDQMIEQRYLAYHLRFRLGVDIVCPWSTNIITYDGQQVHSCIPNWVIQQGIPMFINTANPSHDGLPTLTPVYWNPTFMQDYQQFLLTVAAHYEDNPVFVNAMAYAGIGLGAGDEDSIELALDQHPADLTWWEQHCLPSPCASESALATQWEQYTETQLRFLAQHFAPVPAKFSFDLVPGDPNGPQTLTLYAASLGLVVGQDGEVPGYDYANVQQIYAAIRTQYPHAQLMFQTVVPPSNDCSILAGDAQTAVQYGANWWEPYLGPVENCASAPMPGAAGQTIIQWAQANLSNA